MIDETKVKQIVAEVLKQLDLQTRVKPGTVPVGISNRHCHVSQADLETLFGAGYQLKNMKNLSQPGQFAAEECVTLVGRKGTLEKVRILGPCRGGTQVEISWTDSYALGVPAVVRDSGDTKSTPGAILLGPKGHVVLKEGVIVASRHIHMHTKDAEKMGLKDNDRVSVKTPGPRSIIFNNVLIRVSEKFALDFHLDTDEANAAGLKNGDAVEVIS
ncbi:MAG TPA: phosphate propanoyltransferase [Candidatus Ozemobacteraceae bacterium]|mgnify:CR=1 FL=1|nr:phosphate propanoyltransferase [Candidatus Ozemobacteraceae bacterium]